MLSVIETGGKQYLVEPGTALTIERLEGAEGDIAFDKVLLTASGGEVKIGTPYLKGAEVRATVLGAIRGERKIVFRYHSKTRYRKLKTHRQPYTKVKVLS